MGTPAEQQHSTQLKTAVSDRKAENLQAVAAAGQASGPSPEPGASFAGPASESVPASGAATATAASSKGALVKALVFAAVLIGLLVLSALLGWGDALQNGQLMDALSQQVAEHPVRTALIYVAASLVGCVALALPGVVFALVAGVVFGPLWGTLLCWLAVSVGACLAFVAGRHFLQDAIKPRLRKYALLNRLLFEGVRKSDVYLLAITRLIPIFPYNLQNFAYGITDIAFAPYTFYSALFLLPGTAVYTIAAAGLVDSSNRLLCFGIAVGLLLVTLLVAVLLKRRGGLS